MPRELSFLEEWPLDRLEALYRVAKSTPFFKHPKDMMALRDLLARRRASTEVSLPELKIAA